MRVHRTEDVDFDRNNLVREIQNLQKLNKSIAAFELIPFIKKKKSKKS